MNREIKFTRENDEFNMKIKLVGNEFQNINDLIKDITDKFICSVDEKDLPYIFIPYEAEITSDDDEFLNVFYLMEDTNYPNDKLMKEDKEYLTDDNEIGKNLFYINLEDNILSIRFKSLLALTEDNTKESIWDFEEGKIKRMFIELVSETVKEERLYKIFNENLLSEAILNSDKNKVRDLIFKVKSDLKSLNISLKKFYYGDYVCLTDTPFDMFTEDCIVEIFKLFDFNIDKKVFGTNIDDFEQVEEGYLAGELIFSKNDKVFSTKIFHSMHDNLISDFIDTKQIKIINK